MKAQAQLASLKIASGAMLSLYEHDGAFFITLDGQSLMHSKKSASEIQLGQLGCARHPKKGRRRILIGGLGLGFTLRSVLKNANAQTEIDVVELLPEIITWNQTYLKSLNGSCLDDPRVNLHTADVEDWIRNAKPGYYDGILLDVDNGPVAMVNENNTSLYSETGIYFAQAALTQNGRVIYWSAGPDQPFEARLRQSNFKVEAVAAKEHINAKRSSFVLYVADKGKPQ